MGIFQKQSNKDARERGFFIAKKSGFADEAIKNFQKGRGDAEDLRRELARHDDYFRYVDSSSLKKAFGKQHRK